MKGWSISDMRRFVLSVVKPLKAGKTVTQAGTKATLDNLFPNNSTDDKFANSSPFGFVSFIPKGVVAFYQELYGSGYEPIMLAQLHAERPQPQTQGDVILYSSDASGQTVQVKITLGSDGTISIVSPGNVTINSGGEALVTSTGKLTINSGGDTTVTSTGNVKVSGSNIEFDGTDIQVKGSTVEIGSGALEKIVKGETFMQFFNLHYHIDGFGIPTQPPAMPMDANQLSEKVKSV